MISISTNFQENFVEDLSAFVADLIKASGNPNADMIIEKSAKFGGDVLKEFFDSLQVKIDGMKARLRPCYDRESQRNLLHATTLT